MKMTIITMAGIQSSCCEPAHSVTIVSINILIPTNVCSIIIIALNPQQIFVYCKRDFVHLKVYVSIFLSVVFCNLTSHYFFKTVSYYQTQLLCHTDTAFHLRSATRARWSEGKLTEGSATCSVSLSCDGSGIALVTSK